MGKSIRSKQITQQISIAVKSLALYGIPDERLYR